jgi:hypothetical protein
MTIAFTVLLTLAAPRPAAAWGFDAHRFIIDRMIALLPDEIRPFFDKNRVFIVEHAIDPDLWRVAGWQEEPPRHFLDMDAYGPYPFKELPHDYAAAVKRYGAEFVLKNGTLPWRTEEVYTQLVEAFTLKAGYSRDNIKFFSSVIGHYVSDAHVPLHAALNYDGQLTGQWGIHSRFESELFERYRSKLAIKPGPLFKIANAREFAFDTLTTSFPYVQQILDADKTAVQGRDVYDEQYFTIFFSKVQPIVEKRLSDAITATASIIMAAWIEAGKLPLPVDQPRMPRKVRR